MYLKQVFCLNHSISWFSEIPLTISQSNEDDTMMRFLPKTGRLEKILSTKKKVKTFPFSETIQHIEVSTNAEGDISESTDFIELEKEKKFEELKKKYGNIEESLITWVMVKKIDKEQQGPWS